MKLERVLTLDALTRVCLLLIASSLLNPPSAWAQLLQGAINGNVTDPSHAIVVGVKVTAINEGTSFVRETVTNAAGEYTLPTMPPGNYTITFVAQGFLELRQTRVVVNANETTRADATLSIGQVAQSVTVSAQAAELQADRADVRTDVTTSSLTDLPTTFGRNFQSVLPVIVPGMTAPTSAASYTANPSRSITFTVNGAGPALTNTRVDGTSSQEFGNPGAPLYVPTLEAIEVVNVVTNSFDAEQGLAGGAAVNISVKSGTNSIHGALYEYHSDQHLQAYAWASDRTKPNPKYVNNQFGGTVGGPIRKNKLFYFISYDGNDVRQETPVYNEVPTAAMKAGNLSAAPSPIYDPMTGNANGTGRTAFPGNIIPTSRIDSGIAALLALNEWPNPNVPGTGAWGLSRNYLSAGNSGIGRNQWDSKTNWNATSKLSMFARFGLTGVSWFNPQQFGDLGGPGFSPANSAVGTGSGHVYSGTLSATYTITPKLLIDAYFGYTRNNAQAIPPELNQNLGWTLLGIPGLETSDTRKGGLPALQIDDFAALGPANHFQPQIYADTEKNYVVNMTWIAGSHNVRAGMDLDQQRINQDFEQSGSGCGYCAAPGGFEFSDGTTQLNGGPAGTDFNAFAAFLLGTATNAGEISLIPPEYHLYTNIMGVYVRDQWQATRKLTVTYGVRWDYYGMPTRGDRGTEYLDAQTNQMVICGLAGVPRDCGITKDRDRILPRVGLAYRLTDTAVIRAGYGIASDPETLAGFYGGSGDRQNFPDNVTIAEAAPNTYSYATTLRLGLPPVVPPNYSAGTVSVPTNVGVFTIDNKNFVRSYLQSWNLIIQKQIGGWTASAGYVATRSTDQMNLLAENWSPIGTGTAGEVLNVLAGRTATTTAVGTMGTNKYDSLQIHIEHRLARNFQVLGSYTFAKALGYSTQVAIPYDYGLNYGNLAGVPRNTSGLTLIGDSPFGKKQKWLQNGLGGKILGQWELQFVTTLNTGMPFTATAATTTLNASGSGQFADCLAPPLKLGGIYEWYSTSTFAAPSSGRFGTCGTNNLWGPAMIDLDTGLARNFVISERFSVKFRAEMLNTANTPHHTMSGTSISTGTFMQALSIANTGRDGIDQRTLRFSLRLGW